MSLYPKSQDEDGFNLPCKVEELDRFISRPYEETIDQLRECEGDFMVLGAAGKMGLHLCLLLKQSVDAIGSSARVIAVSRFRSVHGRIDFEKNGIETIGGDLCDPVFLDILPVCENVFYLVGAKFGTRDNPKLLNEINVELPRRVAERYSKSRIVALSTGCVYPYVSPASGGSGESDPLGSVGDYARSCIGRETSFRNVSKVYDTPVAIIRLNYAVELRYGVLVDIARWVKEGSSVPLATGWVNVIWQGDALNQIVRCLKHVASPPKVVNVTGAETLSVRELAAIFASRFGASARFEGSEAADAWLSNSSWAQAHLGGAKVSLIEMIDWIVAWMESGNEVFEKPTGFQNRDGSF